ncbi:hypothetical protein ACYCJ7_17620 [Klebsiella pneumoniae]
MSKQERSVPSYVEYPYEQAILYVHRNASANEMLESVQERLRALLGLLHALERIEVRTGQGVPIQRVAHILVTLGGDPLTLRRAAHRATTSLMNMGETVTAVAPFLQIASISLKRCSAAAPAASSGCR